MVDGEEKSKEPGNQTEKETRELNKHVRANPQRFDNRMSDISNVVSLFFSLCLVVAAFMTFVAICVQAFIYYAQLKEMKKSTDAATKAANMAQESLKQAREAARIDQRAWVGVIGLTGNPTLNQPFIVTVKMKNTGKTFARELRSYVYFQEIPAGNEPDFSLDEEHPQAGKSTTLLAPGGDYETRTDVLDKQKIKVVTQIQLDDWKSGKKLLVAAGKLTYEDVFGCAHWTTFCFYLRPTLNGYSNYEKHNDADDNRCP